MSGEAHQTIGRRMRARRRNKRWSLDQLAAESSVTRSYLWKLETGDDPNPSLITLRKLACALGTSVGWLAGDPVASHIQSRSLLAELDFALQQLGHASDDWHEVAAPDGATNQDSELSDGIDSVLKVAFAWRFPP